MTNNGPPGPPGIENLAAGLNQAMQNIGQLAFAPLNMLGSLFSGGQDPAGIRERWAARGRPQTPGVEKQEIVDQTGIEVEPSIAGPRTVSTRAGRKISGTIIF